MNIRILLRTLLLLAGLTELSGCGLKGALYLPEQPGTPVVITPASSSSSATSSVTSSPTSSQTSP